MGKARRRCERPQQANLIRSAVRVLTAPVDRMSRIGANLCGLVVARIELPSQGRFPRPVALARFSIRNGKQFGAILEMHRIIVIPFAAPNEPVIFKYFDDFFRHAIAISNVAGLRVPEPII